MLADDSVETRPRAHLVGFVAIMMSPYAVLAARWIGTDWFPVQDQAVAALRVSDVLGPHTPLVGAFSRYGWSHPGPIWFWVLSPGQWLLGAPGLVVVSMLSVGAILAATNLIVWRRLGTTAAIVFVSVTTIVVGGADAFGVVTPWNPNLAWPLYGLFLVTLLLLVMDGHTSDLAIAVFIAAALLQLHVGYAVLALLPLLSALTMVSGRLRRENSGESPAWRRPRVWGWLVATLVMWIPPLLDQVLHGRDGNLYRVASWFLHGESGGAGSRVGLADGLGLTAGGLHIPPVGLGYSGENVEPFTGWMIAGHAVRILPVVLVALTALFLAVRSHSARLSRVAGLSLSVLVTGVLAASMVVGDRWPYIFVWRFPLDWFVLASSGWVIVATALQGRIRASPRVRTPLLLGMTVISTIVTLMVLSRWPVGTIRTIEPQVAALSTELLSGPRPDNPTVIREFGPLLDGVGDGLLKAGESGGWPLGVDPALDFKFGAHRVIDGPDHDTWLVTQGSVATTLTKSLPNSEVLASTSPLDEDDERLLTEAQLDGAIQLAENGRTDLIDSLSSPLVGLALRQQGVYLNGGTEATLEKLNEKVERSGRHRLAVVAVGTAQISTYDDALAVLARNR